VPRSKWEDNIKRDLDEMGCVVLNWLGWLRAEMGELFL
jgi:hypothetical protein